MADPLTIIGSAGAICNIVDVVGKSISALNELRTRWKDSDLIFLSLVSQLVSLRAALEKVRAWSESEEQQVHHQLIMDLDVCIACCKLLIIKLDEFVSSLDQPTSRSLDATAKAKVVFRVSGLDGLQKLLERQTNALLLILTACNCETLSQQKKLLERPKSRKTLQRAEKDTASLVVNRDTSSRRSVWTDNLSKISRVFDFDIAILSSPVYERTFRDTMITYLRERREWKLEFKTIKIIVYTNDLDAQDRLIEEIAPADLLSTSRSMETSHEAIEFEWGVENIKLFSMGQSKGVPTRLLGFANFVVFLADADCFVEHPADANTNRKRSEILGHFKSLCSLYELKAVAFYIMFYRHDNHRSKDSTKQCVDIKSIDLTYAQSHFERLAPNDCLVWSKYWRDRADMEDFLSIRFAVEIHNLMQASRFY